MRKGESQWQFVLLRNGRPAVRSLAFHHSTEASRILLGFTKSVQAYFGAIKLSLNSTYGKFRP